MKALKFCNFLSLCMLFISTNVSNSFSMRNSFQKHIKRKTSPILYQTNTFLDDLDDFDDKNNDNIKDKSILKPFRNKDSGNESAISTRTTRTSATINEISSSTITKGATFGSMSVQDLKDKMIEKDAPQVRLEDMRKEEDLNGIQPTKPFAFAGVSALMCFILWKISVYMAGHFAVQFLDPDVTAYPVQRFAVFSRNIVVGVSTLGAGFSGIITLGLILLGGRVGLGVASGELDPNNPKDISDVEQD